MQGLLSFIKLDLLLSIPQTLTILWLAFALIGLRPAGRWKRMVTMAIVNSVYTDLLIRILPTPVHLLNSVAITTLMLFLLFRDVGVRKKLLALLLSYVFGALSDLAMFGMHGWIYGNEERLQMLESTMTNIVCLYPILLVYWLVAVAYEARSALWFENIRAAGGFIRRHGLVQVLVCLLLQLLTGCIVLSARVIPGEYGRFADYLFYATVLLTLPTLYFVVRLIDRTRQHTVQSTQEHYIEQISGMFTSIRGQRHDFLNHIQVMSTMLKLGKYEELRAFMAEIVKETQEVGDIVHHDIPAVAALLKAKTAVALGLGIDLTSRFAGRWDPQSPVKIIDIVKIAGNLIDNAFDEVVKLPAGSRRVRVSFCSFDGYLELAVRNPGPPISEEAKARLFEPGYSTKTGTNRGLGLPIVRERVEHYNGTLTVRSDEKRGTEFSVRLPQRAAQ